MLVCIGAASLAVTGGVLIRDPPSPQDLLSLLIVSMEKPLLGIGAAVLPESVHLDDSAAFELIRSESEQLGVKVVFVKRLSAPPEFKKIVERDMFTRQVGYSGGEKLRTQTSCHLLELRWRDRRKHPALKTLGQTLQTEAVGCKLSATGKLKPKILDNLG
jgi:hypothetical protein